MPDRNFVGKWTWIRPHRRAEIVWLGAAASKYCGQIAWPVHAFVRTSHKPHKAMQVLLDNNLCQDVCEIAEENHNIGGLSKREYKLVLASREHAGYIQAHFEFHVRKQDSGLRKVVLYAAARVFVYAVLTCLCNSLVFFNKIRLVCKKPLRLNLIYVKATTAITCFWSTRKDRFILFLQHSWFYPFPFLSFFHFLSAFMMNERCQ